MSVYRAEYIWIDGSLPTSKLRSKTKVIKSGEEPPIWGFDGSSTNQAPGDESDCVLKPVFKTRSLADFLEWRQYEKDFCFCSDPIGFLFFLFMSCR